MTQCMDPTSLSILIVAASFLGGLIAGLIGLFVGYLNQSLMDPYEFQDDSK